MNEDMNEELAADNFIDGMVAESSEAIEILANRSMDYRRFAVEIAKSSPALFVKIANQIGTSSRAGDDEVLPDDSRLDDAIISLMIRHQKVEAIRLHRTMTGQGLKESRVYCEALLEQHERQKRGCFS